MTTYDDLANDFHSLMGSNPLRLVEREDFSRADELPILTREAKESFAARCRALAWRIKTEQSSATQDPDQLIDLDLAAGWLKAEALEIETPIGGTPRHAVFPSALLDLLGSTPFYLEKDPRPKGDIVQGFIERFANLETYLQQELFRLETPVAVWVKREVESGSDFQSVASGVRQFAMGAGYKPMVSLDAALELAQEHVSHYLDKLKDMPTRSTLSIGPKATEDLFRYRGIEISPRQLHQLAVEQLGSITEELRLLSGPFFSKHRLGLDPLLQLAEAMKRRFAYEKGTVVENAKELFRKAEQFAYDSGLVAPLPNASAKIESTPGYLKPFVPIAAMFAPGPFGKGERRSTYYITEFPGIETALNRLNLPGITAHELIPGHHWQLSRATEHPSPIRKWTASMDLAEGWTTRVAEQLLPECGYVGDSSLKDEERFMALVDQLRFGARVCFTLACLTGDRDYFRNDLGVQVTQPDLIDASVGFYRGITGFEEPRARGDVENFSSVGVYGALYLAGNHLMRRLESLARIKQGKSFKMPRLLEAIVKEGNMPLSYVQRGLENKGIL